LPISRFPRRTDRPDVKVPPAPQIAIAPFPTDRLIATPSAAYILGVTDEVLKKWRQRSQGPEFVRFPNGDIRYRLSTLLKFMEDHTFALNLLSPGKLRTVRF
jgi:hypothetical protein